MENTTFYKKVQIPIKNPYVFHDAYFINKYAGAMLMPSIHDRVVFKTPITSAELFENIQKGTEFQFFVQRLIFFIVTSFL